MLRQEGHERTAAFLEKHADDLGVRSSYDISTLLHTLLEQG